MNEKNIGDFAALPREIIFEILDFITTAALRRYLKMIESKDYLSPFERYSIGLASKDMLNIIFEFIADRSDSGISFHKENISLYYDKNDVTSAGFDNININKKFQSVADGNINPSKDLFMSYDINKFYMRLFCGGVIFKIIDDVRCGLGDNLFKFSYEYKNSEEIKGKISSFTIIVEIIGAKLMFLVEFHRDKISCFRFFAVKDKFILHYYNKIYLFGANGNVLMDRFDVNNEEKIIIEKDRINFIKLLPQNLKDKIALLAEKMNEELKNILIFHVDIRAESIHKFWKKMEEE